MMNLTQGTEAHTITYQLGKSIPIDTLWGIAILALLATLIAVNALFIRATKTPVKGQLIAALTLAGVALLLTIHGYAAPSAKPTLASNTVINHIEEDYNLTLPEQQQATILEKLAAAQQGDTVGTFNIIVTSDVDKTATRTLYFNTTPHSTIFSTIEVTP